LVAVVVTKTMNSVMLQGPCQICNKVEQLCRTALTLNKVARSKSCVAQLLTSWATKLLHRNCLYS